MEHILEIRLLWFTHGPETDVRDFRLFSVRYCMWPIGNKERYLVWSAESDIIYHRYIFVTVLKAFAKTSVSAFISLRTPLLLVYKEVGIYIYIYGKGYAYYILVCSEDSGSDDSQKQADHVEHHRGPKQTVQVDHIPAAADPGELVVLCVVLYAGRGREQGSVQNVKTSAMNKAYCMTTAFHCISQVFFFISNLPDSENEESCTLSITCTHFITLLNLPGSHLWANNWVVV